MGAKALRQGWVCCDLETAQGPVSLSRVKERREVAGPDPTGSVHPCEDVVTRSVTGTRWRALKRVRHGPTSVLKASLALTAVLRMDCQRAGLTLRVQVRGFSGNPEVGGVAQTKPQEAEGVGSG